MRRTESHAEHLSQSVEQPSERVEHPSAPVTNVEIVVGGGIILAIVVAVAYMLLR